MKAARVLLAIGVLAVALFLPTTSGLKEVEAIIPGPGGPTPPNFSFDAGPRSVGTPPQNHDFEDGLNGWTVVSGSPTVRSGGPNGSFIELEDGDEVTSSSFVVPTDAQTMEYQISLADAASSYLIRLRWGPSFEYSWTLDNIICSEAIAFPWEQRTRNITPVAGETVKLEVENRGDCGGSPGKLQLDDVGVMTLVFPHWTVDSGQTESTFELRSGGPSGSYAYLPDHYGIDLVSEPFVVPANAESFRLRAKCDSPDSDRQVDMSYRWLSGPDPEDWKGMFPLRYQCDDLVDWTTVRWWWFDDPIAGESVQLRIRANVSGTAASIDEIGFNLREELETQGPEPPTGGDPFQLTTGAFTHSHTDILIPGRGIPLEFARYYNSQSSYAGALGFRWSHTYSMSLEDEDDDVIVRYDDGGSARFEFVALEQPYTSPVGNHDTLVKHTDGTFTLTTTSQITYDFLSDGRLDTIKDRNNNTTWLHYDVSGHLDYVEDSGGRRLTFSYDASDRIVQITDPLPAPDTRTVGFHYDPDTGDLDEVTDVKDGTTDYDYSNSRMETLTDANGHIAVQNCYDDANRVYKQFTAPPSVQDCANPGPGVATTLASYDSPGDGQTTVTDPRGAETIYTFDTSFRTVEVEDDFGNTVQYQYDPDNNVTCLTDQRGKKTHYSYDSNGNVTQITDALNTNQETCEPVPDPDTSDFTYTALNDLESEADPLGHRTNYIYDNKGNLTRVVQRTGPETDSDIDGYIDGVDQTEGEQFMDTNRFSDCPATPAANDEGQDSWPPDFNDDRTVNVLDIIQLSPPYFNVSPPSPYYSQRKDLNWDGTLNILDLIKLTPPVFNWSCTRPIPGTIAALTCFERDGNGLVTAVVESTDLTLPANDTGACTGNKTEFEYDAYGNQTAVIDPRFSSQPTPPKTVLTYDPGGRMETVTNELGHTTTYGYDNQNNVLSVEDNLGNTTTNTYNAKGNLKTVTDANRQPVGIAPETGADCGAGGGLGTGTGNGQDDDADTVVDDGCPSTIHTYDNADRLTEVVDALGNSTTYGYDENGNRTSVTNANRQQVGPTAEAGPAQCGEAGTGNDADNDGDTVKDDGCPSTIYAYDALDRLESVTDPLSRVTTYRYDPAGNLDDRTDARGLFTDYINDDLNRIDRIDYYDYEGGTLDHSVDYTYDAVGNRKTMNDSTGLTTYVYDELDRPTSVTFPGDDTVAYEYDNVGNRSRITYPDTKEVNYTYDQAGNLKTVTDWLSQQTVYTYDDAGNLTDTDLPNGVDTDYTYDDAGRLESVVNVGPGPTTISSFDYTYDAVGNRTAMEDQDGTHSYEYDPLYRLTEVTYPDEETDTYTYDPVGNRLTKDTDDYTYNDADQMTSAGGVPYGYDENGNQTARGNDTFTYDHENRLTESVIGGVTSTSEYNGDGLRMSHTVDQTTTDYVWDVVAGLPVVLQDGANTYVYGLDLISATGSQGDQTYFLYDGLSSTTGLTDGSGNGVASYGYHVFGELRSGSPGATAFLFTGEQFDSDEELYYLRARYYDPSIGRFLSQDPLPLGNRYSYVRNNPVNYTDRSGLAGFGVGGFLEPCTSFNPWCMGGGGGGGDIIIIGGTVIVIGAAAGGIAVLGEEIADLPGQAWGSFTSFFSRKGGKSEDARIASIRTLSAGIHEDVCRTDLWFDSTFVKGRIEARVKNIQDEYRHLGPTARREAERIFKELAWNNPCDTDPNVPVFPPVFGDGSDGGKE